MTMPIMEIRWPTGEAATLTAAQRASVEQVAARFNLAEPVTVHPLLCGDACVMIAAGTMWLGIEPDGYTHS